MATIYSGNYSTGSYTYTRARVDYSGSSATVYVLYSRTNTYSGATYQTSDWEVRQNNSSGAVISSGNVYKEFYGQTTDAIIWSSTITIDPSVSTTLYISSVSAGGEHYLDFVGSITIPTQYSAPSTPVLTTGSMSNYIDVTYGVSSFGNPSTGTITLYGDLTSSPTTILDTSSTTGNHNYSWTGLVANTKYYLKAVASNGQLSSNKSTNAVTLPPLSTVSVGSVTDTSAVISYSMPSDGGENDVLLEYSIDGGNTWVTLANKTSGSAVTGTTTLSGLAPETAYIVKSRITAGGTTISLSDISFTTEPSVLIYGSVAGKTKRIVKLYGSVAGKTKEIKKLYGSVNGQTKRIF